MPAALFRRVSLDSLYLPFLQPLMDAVAGLLEKGFEYRATVGYRTFPEQARLYFQGRTMPGNVVTDALPGYSPHNYGLAVDFVRWRDGKPSWVSADYDALGEAALRAGLQWGGDFHHPHDRPHVQLPGYVTAQQLEPLKRVYEAHRDNPLPAVFAYLDSTRPAQPGDGRPPGGAAQ